MKQSVELPTEPGSVVRIGREVAVLSSHGIWYRTSHKYALFEPTEWEVV